MTDETSINLKDMLKQLEEGTYQLPKEISPFLRKKLKFYAGDHYYVFYTTFTRTERWDFIHPDHVWVVIDSVVPVSEIDNICNVVPLRDKSVDEFIHLLYDNEYFAIDELKRRVFKHKKHAQIRWCLLEKADKKISMREIVHSYPSEEQGYSSFYTLTAEPSLARRFYEEIQRANTV